MAGQSITFDFLSRGAGQLQGDIRKVGDNTVLAARGAKVLADSIEKLGAKEDRTAAESKILASALRQTGEAEDRVAARAVLADAAIRRLDDSMKDASKSTGGLGKALGGLKLNPGLVGPALALAPAMATLGGVVAGVGAGLAGAFAAGAGALAAFGAVAKPVLTDAKTAATAVETAQTAHAAAVAKVTGQYQYAMSVAKTQAQRNAAYAAEQKGFSAAGLAQTAALSKAYAGLSPAQIALSKQLGAMADSWDKVKAAQTPVVAGALQPWLKSVTDLTKQLGPIIAKVSPVIGSLGSQFESLVSSSAFTAFRDFIANTGSRAAGAAGNALIGFIQAFVILLPKFQPLIQQAVTWLGNLGPAVEKWASSKKTADHITAFMAWFTANGPVVGGLLRNIAGALKAMAPGLTSGGLLELQAISSFMGFVAKLPPGLAKPLFEVAGALLVLKKVGVVTAGVKLVGLGAAATGAGAAAGPLAASGAAIGGGFILAVKNAIQSGWKGVLGILPGLFGGVGGILHTSADGWTRTLLDHFSTPVRHLWSALGHFLAASFDVTRHQVAHVADMLGGYLSGSFAKTRQQLARIWDVTWNNTVGRTQRGFRDVARYFDDFRHRSAAIFDGIRRDIAHVWDVIWSNTVSRARQGVSAFGTAAGRIRDAMLGPVRWVVNNVINRLISAFDWVSNKVGGPNIPQFKFAAGGQVPGQGRGDVVPAMLTPGEVVVPAGMVAAGVVDHLRGMLPGFAKGGRVGQPPPVPPGAGSRFGPIPGVGGVIPALGSILSKAGDLARILAAVTTGNATAASNAFRDLLGGGVGGASADLAGMLAALPARLIGAAVRKLLSFGGSSSAIVADAMRWIGKIPYVWGGTAVPGGADCSGFTQTIYSRHGIHAPRTSEEQGAWVKRSGAVPGALAFYNSPAGGPPPGHVAIVKDGSMVISQGGGMGPQLMPLTGALPLMFTGVPPGGFGKAGGGAGPGGGAPAANAALARSLYPAWGSGTEWLAWNALEMAEAGWNQFARNPSSGAYGIPQALPESKLPFAGQAAGGSNPAAQIRWMHDYIAQVYGDPIGANMHENMFHWYARGGLVPGYAAGGAVTSTTSGGPAAVAAYRKKLAAAQAREGRDYLGLERAFKFGPAKYRTGPTMHQLRVLAAAQGREQVAYRHLAGAGLTKVNLDKLAAMARAESGQAGAHSLSHHAGWAKGLRYWLGQLSGTAARGLPGGQLTSGPGGLGLPAITHSYGGDVANNLGAVLAAALAPFTGKARGGMVMDSGGTLRPGFNPVWNMTGRPEPLVPARGGAGRLQIEWVGSNGGDELERWIRKNVRIRGGGDVQKAYGAR